MKQKRPSLGKKCKDSNREFTDFVKSVTNVNITENSFTGNEYYNHPFWNDNREDESRLHFINVIDKVQFEKGPTSIQLKLCNIRKVGSVGFIKTHTNLYKCILLNPKDGFILEKIELSYLQCLQIINKWFENEHDKSQLSICAYQKMKDIESNLLLDENYTSNVLHTPNLTSRKTNPLTVLVDL